ncbi:CULT domain-containing protein [Candidatus Magnetomoraceae bacterium gMMP-15]
MSNVYQIHSSNFRTNPLWAFQKFTEAQLEKLKLRLAKPLSKKKKEKNQILCKICKNKITLHDNIIEINGSHKHIFTNPAGIIFQIGCFSMADGCIQHGLSTTEHTWFAGFSWRFAFCSSCHSHLGWFYHSKGTESFYGLILNYLIEGQIEE